MSATRARGKGKGRNKKTKASADPAVADVELTKAQVDFDSRHKELKQQMRDHGIDSQFETFLLRVTMDDKKIRMRYVAVEALRNILVPRFANVTLYPFGSLVTGLGDFDSDIDIYVDCSGNADGNENSASNRDFAAVLKILSEHRDVFGNIVPISTARIPIIRFVYIANGIKCDLSFANMLSVQNTRLIGTLLQLDSRAKPLMLLIRYWARFHNLTSSTTIKSYGLCLMVLVFLMLKKIIPSVYMLQNWHIPPIPFTILGWNASFFFDIPNIRSFLDAVPDRPRVTLDPSTAKPTTISILQLALEFWDLYKNFNYEKFVICPLAGGFVDRAVFLPQNAQNLPVELFEYRLWIYYNKGDTKQGLCRASHQLVIQDPFQVDFNVSRGTSQEALEKFKSACASVSHLLRSRILEEGTCTREGHRDRPNLMKIFSPLQPAQKEKFRIQADLKELPSNAVFRFQMEEGLETTIEATWKEKFGEETPITTPVATLWQEFAKEFLHTFIRTVYVEIGAMKVEDKQTKNFRLARLQPGWTGKQHNSLITDFTKKFNMDGMISSRLGDCKWVNGFQIQCSVYCQSLKYEDTADESHKLDWNRRRNPLELEKEVLKRIYSDRRGDPHEGPFFSFDFSVLTPVMHTPKLPAVAIKLTDVSIGDGRQGDHLFYVKKYMTEVFPRYIKYQFSVWMDTQRHHFITIGEHGVHINLPKASSKPPNKIFGNKKPAFIESGRPLTAVNKAAVAAEFNTVVEAENRAASLPPDRVLIDGVSYRVSNGLLMPVTPSNSRPPFPRRRETDP